MIKQLGILDTATAELKSRRRKNTAPDLETAAVTATAGKKGVAEEAVLECASPAAVSVVSKEQAMQLLMPVHHEQVTVTRKRSTSTTSKSKIPAGAEPEDSSLEGKFVDLADLLLPVPSKGEFDVNKIKSSLYFFS
jgi:DNA-directed RNA polymerase